MMKIANSSTAGTGNCRHFVFNIMMKFGRYQLAVIASRFRSVLSRPSSFSRVSKKPMLVIFSGALTISRVATKIIFKIEHAGMPFKAGVTLNCQSPKRRSNDNRHYIEAKTLALDGANFKSDVASHSVLSIHEEDVRGDSSLASRF